MVALNDHWCAVITPPPTSEDRSWAPEPPDGTTVEPVTTLIVTCVRLASIRYGRAFVTAQLPKKASTCSTWLPPACGPTTTRSEPRIGVPSSVQLYWSKILGTAENVWGTPGQRGAAGGTMSTVRPTVNRRLRAGITAGRPGVKASR